MDPKEEERAGASEAGRKGAPCEMDCSNHIGIWSHRKVVLGFVG